MCSDRVEIWKEVYGCAGGLADLPGTLARTSDDGPMILLAHEPELWEMLWGTVGLHPELRVRLLHGDADTTPPPEVSAAFATVLAEAGYDVEVVEFDGGHRPPDDLTAETVMEIAP